MRLADPPIDRYRIRLHLTQPARFRFLHGGVLRGLISRALERHDLPPGLVPSAPESGRTQFAPGDSYQLGVTLTGEDRRLAGRLLAGLVKVGQRHLTAAPRPTLGGNFEIESLEPLPPIDVDREVETLLAAPATTLQMLSPLRLRRPRDLTRPGAAYLNADCLPASHLLERLWARLFLLTAGRYPEADELRRRMPPIPASARATPGEMPWLDLPVAGGSGKEKPYTLGGVMGCMRLRGITEDWLHLLVLGRHLHQGAGTAYGLGRYKILEDPTAEPFQPAHRLWSRDDGRAITPEQADDADPIATLHAALATLLEDSSHAYRLGLSGPGAARAERIACREGYHWRTEADLSDLLSLVDPRCVAQRARAVFPLDPPPRLSPDSPQALRDAHALLVLPEIAAALAPDRKLLWMEDGYCVLARRPMHASVPFEAPQEQVPLTADLQHA